MQIRTFGSLNDDSQRFQLEPWFIDPSPGKALALAAEATASGLRARSREGRIEDVLAEGSGESVVCLHLDRPQGIARALRVAADRGQAVFVQLLIAVPSGPLHGLRLVLSADEGDLKLSAASFFDALGRVTARSGSAWVIGEQGRPEHRLSEPSYRNWFANHFEQNLGKVVAGVEPESQPIELTRDGRTTWPAVLADSATGWKDPKALASELVADPPAPLLRGTNFHILETGPDGVRIHDVRLRMTDGRVSVFGTAIVDRAAVARAEEAERERLRRETEAILKRAERATLSKLWAALTTD